MSNRSGIEPTPVPENFSRFWNNFSAREHLSRQAVAFVGEQLLQQIQGHQVAADAIAPDLVNYSV